MGAAGELVGPSEPDALAERLRQLAGDPSRLESLRGQAAVLASERSWQTVARRHLDVYGEVTDADRAPGRRLRAAYPRGRPPRGGVRAGPPGWRNPGAP